MKVAPGGLRISGHSRRPATRRRSNLFTLGGVEVGTGLRLATGRVGHYAQNLPPYIGRQAGPNLDHVCQLGVENAGSVSKCAGL